MRRMLFGLCLIVFFLAGCWDRREINDLALVLATGIDRKGEETFELSVQLAIPQALATGQQGTAGGQGGGSGAKATTVETADGETIYDAMSRLQEKVPRRIFWGHNRIIVIGEEMAQEEISRHLDFFIRHPQPRLRTYLFISKGKASDVLNVFPALENSSAEAAQELTNMRFGLQVTIKEYLQMINGSGAAALPWLEIPPPEPEKGEKTSKTLWLNGSAIIKKDKMIGRIDDRVTRGLLWLRNEIELASITVPSEIGQGLITCQLLKSRTELVPEIKNGQWAMTVKVDTYDDIVENRSNLNVGDPSVAKVVEKEIEKQIANRIQQALNQIQKEMQADAFGFAEAFHRKYPTEWEKAKERWDEIFPEIDVKIISHAKLKRSGLSTEPPSIPKEEVQQDDDMGSSL